MTIGGEVDYSDEEVEYIAAPLSRRQKIGWWISGLGIAVLEGSTVYIASRGPGFHNGNNWETWLYFGGMAVGAGGLAISHSGRIQPAAQQLELPLSEPQ